MTAGAGFADAAGGLALLLRATLLIGFAWVSAAALRSAGASAAARHMAWLSGIAALLALPILWWLVPALHLPILPAEAEAAGTSSAGVPVLRVLPGPTAAEAPVLPGWSLPLAAYATGAAILLARLVVGRRMLSRLWRESGAVSDPAWTNLLARLSSEMRLPRRVELRIARSPAVPMTWGTWAPKLLLPAEAASWPLERRRLVLLHELAHVARRDSLSRSLASLACALYWFHPGAWFAARRMRLEQEHAADDRVLIAGGSAQAYALSLLDLAKGPGPRFDQAPTMAGMYQLERRLVSITGPARRNRPGAAFLSSSALVAALATWLVAAAVPVSATPGLPGRFRTKPAGLASPVGPDSGPSVKETPAEMIANASAAVSGSRPKAPRPGTGDLAQRRQVRRDIAPERGAVGPGDPAGQDRPPSPALADQVRDYGWELPRRDLRMEIGSSAEPSARLVRPTPLSPATERTRLSKWTRSIPRLVRTAPRTGTSIPSSQGDLVLSLAIEVGGR